MDSATAPPPPSEHQHEHERLLDKMAHASVGAFDPVESQAPSQPQSKPPSESEESILEKLASAFTHQNQNQNQKPKPGSQQSQSLDPRRHSHSPYVASAVPSSKAAHAARDGGAAEAEAEVAHHGPGVLEKLGLGAEHWQHAPPVPNGSPPRRHNVLDHLGLGLDHHGADEQPLPPPTIVFLRHGVWEPKHQDPAHAPPLPVASTPASHHSVLDHLGLGSISGVLEKLGLGAVTAPPLAPQPQHHSLLEKLRLEHPPTSTSHDHAGGHHGGGVVHKLEEALHLDEDSEEDASTRKQRHNGDAGGLVRKISGALGLDGRLAIGHPKDESSMLDKVSWGCKEPRTPYEEAVDAMKKELKNVEHRLDRS
ncbi:hypothetical protein C8F01DRAFT_1099181 [Mycena amicta]|nr:hypothetical protein C8F01DRAFT_1099181 [Mycena amicta]